MDPAFRWLDSTIEANLHGRHLLNQESSPEPGPDDPELDACRWHACTEVHQHSHFWAPDVYALVRSQPEYSALPMFTGCDDSCGWHECNEGKDMAHWHTFHPKAEPGFHFGVKSVPCANVGWDRSTFLIFQPREGPDKQVLILASISFQSLETIWPPEVVIFNKHSHMFLEKLPACAWQACTESHSHSHFWALDVYDFPGASDEPMFSNLRNTCGWYTCSQPKSQPHWHKFEREWVHRVDHLMGHHEGKHGCWVHRTSRVVWRGRYGKQELLLALIDIGDTGILGNHKDSEMLYLQGF